jgi:hypothetical protein
VLSENSAHQIRIRTCGNTVYSVIRAHDGTDLGVSCALLEWLQVVFRKILLRNLRVEVMSCDASPVLEIIRGVVLACREDATLLRIVAFQP